MSICEWEFASLCKDPDTLEHLARTSQEEETLSAIVVNENTENQVLMQLTDCRFPSVRSQIIFHDSVTPDIIEKLAEDDSSEVLASLAMALTEPHYEDILEKLSENPNRMVQYALSTNPKTPDIALATLAKSNSLVILLNVARHHNIDAATQEKLSQSPIHALRMAIASNPVTKKYILMTLCKDPAKDVAAMAQAMLDKQISN